MDIMEIAARPEMRRPSTREPRFQRVALPRPFYDTHADGCLAHLAAVGHALEDRSAGIDVIEDDCPGHVGRRAVEAPDELL